MSAQPAPIAVSAEPRPFLSALLPFLPISKKNGTHIRRRGSKQWVSPTARVQSQQAAIRALAMEALSRRKIALRPLAGRSVRMRLTWQVARGMALLELFDLGPLQKIPGPRRDLGNMACIVLDALNDVAYDDDSQVHEIVLTVDRKRG